VTPAAPQIAVIALGANLGDPRAALDTACLAIAALPATRLRKASSLYRTAPIDASGPDYLNAVIEVETRLDPPTLLAALLRIEQGLGRERPHRNAPRTLDLDLLLHGQTTCATERLTLPHPRMHLRAFVLLPLAEIAPALELPGHGMVGALLPGVADQRIERLAA
jgi:2-amino-4-hydroxy-6-hydroxymethyldihydropteridine diphosphokinase